MMWLAKLAVPTYEGKGGYWGGGGGGGWSSRHSSQLPGHISQIVAYRLAWSYCPYINATHSHTLCTISQTHCSHTRPFLWSHSQIVQSGYKCNYLHLSVPHLITQCIFVMNMIVTNIDSHIYHEWLSPKLPELYCLLYMYVAIHHPLSPLILFKSLGLHTRAIPLNSSSFWVYPWIALALLLHTICLPATWDGHSNPAEHLAFMSTLTW